MSDQRQLKVGVLGCGPIAQFAHFDACNRAANAELHAICDVAGDLVERMAAVHRPARTYTSYADMLADPDLEAVIVAVADQFHVARCHEALAAGKHVLVEKPMGRNVSEAEAVLAAAAENWFALRYASEALQQDPAVRRLAKLDNSKRALPRELLRLRLFGHLQLLPKIPLLLLHGILHLWPSLTPPPPPDDRQERHHQHQPSQDEACHQTAAA